MIAFIDTEVNPKTEKVVDYGAVKEDGTVLHSRLKSDFDIFVSGCEVVCGHNILNFDLKYTSLKGNHTIIDTLVLSPLLFPKRPYHHLVKDDKLQVDELNNPANDAMKARDLFFDEVTAWEKLSAGMKEIYFQLLRDTPEFRGFFKYVGYTPSTKQSFLGRMLNTQPDWTTLILNEYKGKVCDHADFNSIARQRPRELAYSLAVIGADDLFSITPGWVMHNYPEVVNVMKLLRNTSCGMCDYCFQKLDAHNGLKEFFGYDEFRTFDGKPMQQQAIEAALRGESLLTIFPTGGGKSLTFQLPALMTGKNIHGLTIVISPLQSLMKDQVDNLAARGISDAVTINGLLDPIERAAAIEQVDDGRANMLYIAPEMLRSKTIERLLLKRDIVRFVIDEAHCFSAWGQDFRVDYMYIGDFIRKLQEKKQLSRPIAVSCFTATAKPKVITDIREYFRWKLGLELKIFAANAERKNLRYSVIHAETDDEKYILLRAQILTHNCPTIVYASRTRRSVEIAERLVRDGFAALPFNGKMEVVEKVKNQNAFMNGKAQIIVATSAFGMGVDKKDVGLVVHYDISDSLENYVQEAGRAGRDPHTMADCFVLYTDGDLDKHFILLNQTKLSISEIQQVWKAIRELTTKREKVNCSPLDIAHQAGWDDEMNDVETRVKAAISALENAGFVHRGSNSPHVFATGISVRNMDEARQKLNDSKLFDEQSREESARIIKSLISARSTFSGRGAEAESRVDYLADILGMNKATVIQNINLMRQDGLLLDNRDIKAWITKGSSAHNLEMILRLEQFLLKRFTQEPCRYNYKELNDEAHKEGINHASIKRMRMLLHFLMIKGYIHKREHHASECVNIHLRDSADVSRLRFERRREICTFIIKTLTTRRDSSKEATLVEFSVVELHKQFVNLQKMSMFAEQEKITIADVEEALLYLSKTDLMKIEGGFFVLYNTMQISRLVERGTRYGKAQYRLLDDFYKQRIQQIHIVGEFANLMVRDYDAALRFVNDYFTMDYRRFINLYFKEDRRKQIVQNITPTKYKQLFGELSDKQREIIDNKQSKYIVVAAGPGSGKTRVLVHKLASLLLMEDVKHEQLLMLTFSRAAATEFKKRLIALVGNAAHFVDIKTFHSYCFDLIGKMGNMDEMKDVVNMAATMIEQGEVEAAKISKSVLVIDEAQDMAEDDFRLVQALMRRNEDMRVIAVGDDDQNIYEFRKSSSRYMQSFLQLEDAKVYEMTDNYRSAHAIVNYANRFVEGIPNRLKHTTIRPVTEKDGRVTNVKSIKDIEITPQGTTAVLTRTNEDALQIAYQLKQKGQQVTLAQSLSSIRFGNLAEARYFLKQLSKIDSVAIDKETWEEAKSMTLKAYETSSCLDIMRHFFDDFEKTHKVYYMSDVRNFVFESFIEDFVFADKQSIFVGTIHKAKGREFDTVYLLSTVPNRRNAEDMRTYYVGLTRAKQNLYLLTQPILDLTSISIALDLHDVWLSYFKDLKKTVLQLRSGDDLRYSQGMLTNVQGATVAALSVRGREKLKSWKDAGYAIRSAKVSYIVAWKPEDDDTEYAVCLANIMMSKMA